MTADASIDTRKTRQIRLTLARTGTANTRVRFRRSEAGVNETCKTGVAGEKVRVGWTTYLPTVSVQSVNGKRMGALPQCSAPLGWLRRNCCKPAASTVRDICDWGQQEWQINFQSIAGLNAAAVNSTDVAEALTAGAQDDAALGGQPSHAGVAAFGAALTRFRARQSDRVSQQGTDMRTGSTRYEVTDHNAADDLTRWV